MKLTATARQHSSVHHGNASADVTIDDVEISELHISLPDLATPMKQSPGRATRAQISPKSGRPNLKFTAASLCAYWISIAL